MSAPGPDRRSAMIKSERAFRTISEVAGDLGVPQHVLRFWETRFTQVRPIKRNGGRRLYRPDHVALLRGIRALLYDDAMTIKGVQKMLREKGVRAVIARGEGGAGLGIHPGLPEDATARLAAIRDRMTERDARQEPELPFDAPPASREEEPGRERVRASIARLEDILARLQA